MAVFHTEPVAQHSPSFSAVQAHGGEVLSVPDVRRQVVPHGVHDDGVVWRALPLLRITVAKVTNSCCPSNMSLHA